MSQMPSTQHAWPMLMLITSRLAMAVGAPWPVSILLRCRLSQVRSVLCVCMHKRKFDAVGKPYFTCR